MNHLLLLAVTLGLAGAAPLEGSSMCQPHSRPWQVYLHSGGKSCSGALINEWWIVTSFQCTFSSNAIATLGDQDITGEEGTEQNIRIADAIQHSPYRSPFHSLTLVRLSAPARFNQYVQPIPLPSRCPQPGDTCTVSGWGSTIPNQYEPRQHLKCITVPVVDDKTCMKTLPDFMYWSNYMVCAGQAHTSNCLNNDGAVMVCDGQLQGVQWIANGCSNPAAPSVYTKLCKYNDWISSVIRFFAPTLPPTTRPTTLPTTTVAWT